MEECKSWVLFIVPCELKLFNRTHFPPSESGVNKPLLVVSADTRAWWRATWVILRADAVRQRAPCRSQEALSSPRELCVLSTPSTSLQIF